MDHEEYLRRVKSNIKAPTKDMEEQLGQFCELCTYISGQYDQDESFINLRKHIEEIEHERQGNETNRVFYMALPPSVFITVSQHLKKNCYPESGIARLIVSNTSRQQRPCQTAELRACRLRSRLGKTSKVRANYRKLWRPIGKKTRSSASTTTWERKWSKTSLF